ncbi:FAD dependent oxidoreductase [Sulfolobus acidocaldarius SUSAZ]|nr:FAD dependent oxidoreductase [Sulfolobus acidocaldarius SUSAZ]
MKVLVVGKGILGSSIYHMLKEKGHEVSVVESGFRKFPPTLIHSLLLVGKDVELSILSKEFYLRHNIPLKSFTSYTLGKVSNDVVNKWLSLGLNVEEKYVKWLGDRAIIGYGTDSLVQIRKLIDSVPKISGNVSVEVNNNKLRVTLDDNDVTSKYDIFILTAGAWNTLSINGLRLPLKSYYCWSWLTLNRNSLLDKVFIYDYELGYYSRPFMGIGLPLSIVGDGDVIECSPFDKKIGDRKAVERAESRVGKLFPIYRGEGYCEGTPDMRPVYGEITDRLYFAGGLDGYGAEVGPGIANLLVTYILEGEKESDYYWRRFNGVTDFKIGKEPHEL